MKKILVVVDMQKDFVDGALGSAEAVAIVPAVVNKIKNFDGEIFATLDTHFDNYMDTNEGKKLPVPHCIKGTDGWKLNGDVADALKDKKHTLVEKNTFGSVTLPDLIEKAAEGGEFSVELIGLCTDICVVSNALMIKARFPEISVSVDEACCAGVTPEKHAAALDTMRSCQIDVYKSKIYKFDVEKVKDECVAWIRDFFEKNGPGCNAVLGVSGGKDSSVTAALCVEALGADRVIGVLMPNGEQADIDMSKLLVNHLGIKHFVVNIKDAYDGVVKNVPFELSKQSRENLPPRLRMSTVYAVSQSNNGRVANTCNLSEDWVGYSTRYGDSVGDFSPLSNLTVQEVKAIGRLLGLPAVLVDKAPADGLCGKTDEDNLGFTYAELDRYIREGIQPSPEKKERIDSLHIKNAFKLQLMPSFKPEI